MGSGRRRNAVVPYVLAGLLAFAAMQVWLVAMDSASLALVSCNSTFSVFAESTQCRWPAVHVGIGWILFSAALASGLIGGVRAHFNRSLQAPRAMDAPRDAHPST
jgi:hypothetical protein